MASINIFPSELLNEYVIDSCGFVRPYYNGGLINTSPRICGSERGIMKEFKFKYVNDSKVEKKIQSLEELAGEKLMLLDELEIANKHVDVFEQIESLKRETDELLNLIKGYETLDDMCIANVILNSNVLITITLNGEKAISRPEGNDEFNFETAFFMNLIKLGDNVPTQFYDYSLHAAIEDIKNGGLK